ncbi:MAG TPA: glycosyltransferase family 39 protein [Candidatus Acidoferrales bacterium]|nr:glycosyltransferase family 39 protein [Candidatus Acidoferrales bacterium]
MLTLVSIFFGAAFTLATAYALGAVLLRQTPAPPEIALGLGAVAESFLVFLCLLLNVGHWAVYLGIGLAALAALVRFRPVALGDPVKAPLGKAWIAAGIVFGAYGVWYFVNALAPETTPDGVTYHLGLPYEYVRLGGFPDHIAFYGMVPEGMEMLYTVAFAFGRHSAAKLVEWSFFVATLPLIFRISRRLGMPDRGGLVAAIFYFCAPVVGLTGSSSYNDAAGVFFMLAAFYLLLVWRDTEPDNRRRKQNTRYLVPAGLLAGFCYAIKMPGLMAAAAAVLFVLAHRNCKAGAVVASAVVAAAAGLAIVPWLVRNAVLTGNPLAPLMNGLFPNPYFHVSMERELASGLGSLGAVKPWQIPWELALGDGLFGTYGPLLLAIPLGLLALRRSAGRLCWAGAAIMALPWLANTGARFLMPSVAFGALALGMALPAPTAWAAILLQAIFCWPQLAVTWETSYGFRLYDFPLEAALRIESEEQYCRRRFDEYNVAKMMERVTPPDSRTLALLSVANAYLDREVSVTWQSAEGERLLDSLRLASVYSGSPAFDWKASWPMESLRALRFRLPVGYQGECDISEVQLYSADYRIYPSPAWTASAWPNQWEGPLAFDSNIATRWRTWEPVRAGMYFEIDLDHPQRLSGALLISHTPAYRPPLEFYGQGANGRWHLLSNRPTAEPRPPQDLRLEASRALRRAGFRYLLAATGAGGNAPIGNVLLGHEPEWGMERVGEAGRYYLFHVK